MKIFCIIIAGLFIVGFFGIFIYVLMICLNDYLDGYEMTDEEKQMLLNKSLYRNDPLDPFNFL